MILRLIFMMTVASAAEYVKDTSCKAFSSVESFTHRILSTCPVTYQSGSNDPLFDPNDVFFVRCPTLPPTGDDPGGPMVLNATEVLALLKYRDNGRRQWCMLTLFYAHQCPFSRDIAPHFNALAALFPDILPVAIDATQFSKLNFRYGVTGTPTVLLWHAGVAVARMQGTSHDLAGLSEFIVARTDQLPRFSPKTTNITIPDGWDVLVIDMDNKNAYDLEHTLVCFAVTLLLVLYTLRKQVLYSKIVQLPVVTSFGVQSYERLLYLFYLPPPPRNDPVPEPQPEQPPRAPIPPATPSIGRRPSSDGPEELDQMQDRLDPDAIERDANEESSSSDED
ncbi:unnamed protein product [Caenorhabditis auriculariae]|uniref:Thioredoxin domain-containing protein n=1 Tax=Caenorhabditis auriculariae TaxID=2777116 RepID=A0A8S1HIJ2_9PELO|nr:unnamed protein product [Caenorhabditis auriculariae]